MRKIEVKGTIVGNADKWIYEWFGMDATCPKDVNAAISEANGEPLLVEIQPHQTLEEDKPHSGEEFGYVMSGRLNVYLGDKVYRVKAGESFYYRTTKRHRISNPGNRPAKYLWISTPPEF